MNKGAVLSVKLAGQLNESTGKEPFQITIDDVNETSYKVSGSWITKTEFATKYVVESVINSGKTLLMD